MNKNNKIKSFFVGVLVFLRVIISLLLMVVPSFYFGIKGQEAQMGYSILVSGICVLIINFDILSKKLESIKLKDFDVRFNKAIDDAYATIEQLNKTKHELTGITVEIIKGYKKYGGCGTKKEFDMINSLYELNKECDDTVNVFIKSGYKQLIRKSFGKIVSAISNAEDKKKVDEILSNSSLIKVRTVDVDLAFSIPSKKAICNTIENLNIDKKSMEEVTPAISLYDEIVCKYQSIYNDLSFVDVIKA